MSDGSGPAASANADTMTTADAPTANAPMHTLTVLIDDEVHTITAPHGANVRRTLLGHGFTPYAPLTQYANCNGRGICATCGVHVEAGEPPPVHWHDKLAARFGYPRLSCQMTLNADMTVRILTEKWVWGARDPSRRYDEGW